MISPWCQRPDGGRTFASQPSDVLAVHRRRGLPRLVHPRRPVHAGHQLPPQPAHVGARRRFPLHDSVDLPGGAASRQPRRDLHQRRRSSTPRCSRPSAARRARSTWSSTSFSPERIADQFIAALSERARHGVNVTIVVDAIGSFSLWGRPVRRLRKAGCRIESYQRLRWHSLARVNNRTHRELLIVDGRVAFAGGAGIADWWAMPRRKNAPAVARHDGADRGARRRGAAGRRGRELAGVLRRNPDRPGVLPESRRRSATRRRSSCGVRRPIARPRRASRFSC